jgi:flagellar protein FliS
MYGRTVGSYRQVYLESAPPSRILDELFHRLRRDCRDARACIARGDLPGKSAAIDHAIAIVAELNAALDFSLAPELCAMLSRLYGYVGDELLQASARLDQTAVMRAERIIEDLHGAFAAAIEQQASAPPPAPPKAK